MNGNVLMFPKNHRWLNLRVDCQVGREYSHFIVESSYISVVPFYSDFLPFGSLDFMFETLANNSTKTVKRKALKDIYKEYPWKDWQD